MTTYGKATSDRTFAGGALNAANGSRAPEGEALVPDKTATPLHPSGVQ